jgi:hypothetical protein
MNDKLGFDFTNLVAICTDGAPAMCGKVLEQLLFLNLWETNNKTSLHYTSAGSV